MCGWVSDGADRPAPRQNTGGSVQHKHTQLELRYTTGPDKLLIQSSYGPVDHERRVRWQGFKFNAIHFMLEQSLSFNIW